MNLTLVSLSELDLFVAILFTLCALYCANELIFSDCKSAAFTFLIGLGFMQFLMFVAVTWPV